LTDRFDVQSIVPWSQPESLALPHSGQPTTFDTLALRYIPVDTLALRYIPVDTLALRYIPVDTLALRYIPAKFGVQRARAHQLGGRAYRGTSLTRNRPP